MNAFNRVVTILLFLFLALAGAAAFMVLIGIKFTLGGGFLQQQMQFLTGLSGGERALAILASVVFTLLMLFLVALEAPKANKKERTIVVRSDESGVTSVNRRSVERYAERIGSQVPLVSDITCSVWNQDGGLEITCEPVLPSGSSVQGPTEEVRQRVHDGVERALGLPVRQMRVRARYSEKDGKARAEQQLPKVKQHEL